MKKKEEEFSFDQTKYLDGSANKSLVFGIPTVTEANDELECPIHFPRTFFSVVLTVCAV